MKIENNKVVELTYELTVDGKVVDKAETKPLDYIHGTHMLLPKFETEIEGLEPGSEFAFTLTPEEGYGEYDPKHKFDLPKSAFEVDGVVQEELLKIGNIVPMLNSAGMVVQGVVASISEDVVTMDFNHPMAGKTLNFTGKIVSVRDATEKELTEGLHGEFIPHEGGCHVGCHGGCHGGCNGEGHEEGHECHCNEEGHECHCHEEGHECHCHEEGHEHGGHEEGHECHCNKD